MRLNLSSRTQLALLSYLRQSKNPLQKGFTLVELMIVVAVIGILSAVALPQFLNARNAADSGSRIGSGVGLAKECGVLAASDIGSAPASATNIAVACSSSGGTVTVTLVSGASGLRCLTSTSLASSGTATISITANGTTTCAFS